MQNNNFQITAISLRRPPKARRGRPNSRFRKSITRGPSRRPAAATRLVAPIIGRNLRPIDDCAARRLARVRHPRRRRRGDGARGGAALATHTRRNEILNARIYCAAGQIKHAEGERRSERQLYGCIAPASRDFSRGARAERTRRQLFPDGWVGNALLRREVLGLFNAADLIRMRLAGWV